MVYLVYFLAFWKLLEIFVKISKEIKLGVYLYLKHKKSLKKGFKTRLIIK